MESPFSSNPIKVHHVDYTYNTSTLVVFVGEVPPYVRKDLDRIKNQMIPKNQVSKFKGLEKFYGSKWIKTLGLQVDNIAPIVGGGQTSDERKGGCRHCPQGEDKSNAFTVDDIHFFDKEQIVELLKGEPQEEVPTGAMIELLGRTYFDHDGEQISAADILDDATDKYSSIVNAMDRAVQQPIYLMSDPTDLTGGTLVIAMGTLWLMKAVRDVLPLVTAAIITKDILDKAEIKDADKTSDTINTDLVYGGGNDPYMGGASDDEDLDVEQIEALLSVPIKSKKDMMVSSKMVTKEAAKRKQVKRKKYNEVVFVYDYTIYPADKISEFKEKIYVATDVQPFRQHLWYRSQGKPKPIAYNVWINGKIFTPDLIYHLTHSTDMIDTIPINMEWFHKKDETMIEAYDEFRIIKEIYEKENITTFYMIDIDSVIPNIALKEQEIVYYGCIKLFFPMISNISVFKRYLNISRSEFAQEYNLLCTSRTDLLARFTKEHELFLHYDELVDDTQSNKYITGNTLTSITSALITAQPVIEQRLSIRNIFDMLELNPLINFARANFLHNNKRYEITKKYLTYTPTTHLLKERVTMGSIIINVQLGLDTQESIYVIIFQNGNLIIKSQWREEYYFGFNEIFDTVKRITDPLFKQINQMGTSVFGPSNARIVEFDWDNIKFSEIDMSLFWKQPVTSKQFDTFDAILKQYEKAGIIEAFNIDYREFIFKKGMFQFDPNRINKMISVSNHFDHLTEAIVHQKWLTLFGRTRRLAVTQRFSDLKLDIVGIREEEYKYFFTIMKTILYDFYQAIDGKTAMTVATSKVVPKAASAKSAASIKQDVVNVKTFNELLTRRQKKALTDLKEKDPELYNTKKLYGEDTPYSKICQKPFQPVTLEESELKYLPADKRARAIKYYNFTTHRDIFYYCPQDKYPWIKFLTHKHPKGYCIPCCKKTAPVEDSGTLRETIHNTCLTSHIYTEEKRTLTEGSRYITTYGKPIDVGRLSNLPEGGLTNILLSKLRLQQKSASRCNSAQQKAYYIVGVAQNYNTKAGVGMLFCLADATQQRPQDILSHLAKSAAVPANKSQLKFTKLYQLTSNESEIVNEIESMSLSIDWNKVIQELAFLFMGINILELEDPGDGSIQMIAHHESPDRMFPMGYKTLIVIHHLKNETYYPMYELVSETFFKTGMADTRLFASDHVAIKKFSHMIAQRYAASVKSSTVSGKIVKTIFDLDILEEYLRQQTLWKIIGLLINSKSMCYLVQMTTNKGTTIYIPVAESGWRGSPQSYRVVSTQTYPSYGEYRHITGFISEYNAWMARLSHRLKLKDNTIYPTLTPTSLLLLKGKPIGFEAGGGLGFYCTAMPRLTGVPVKTLVYDPLRVNTALMTKTPAIDWRTKNEGSTIRTVFLYRLYITEIYYFIMRKKNTAVRTRLKKTIAKTDFSKPLPDNFYLTLTRDLSDDDKLTITNIIQKHTIARKKILQAIDYTHFEFDDFIGELKKQTKDNVFFRLKRELRHLFSFTELRDIDEIPNILSPCDDSTPGNRPGYCSVSGKLIISEKQFDSFTNYLSYVITSPILNQSVFAHIDIHNTIDFFNFTQRPMEIIS